MNIEEVWSQFGNQLRHFILARVRDPDLADELTQELLIKSYQSLDSIKDEGRVDAWLYRIAHNVIIDHYRKMKREEEKVLPEMGGFVELFDQESLHKTVHDELSHCIQPFIDQLPEKYRLTLTAIDLEGYSQKEFAEKLGVSHSTIKSRTQRGRIKLSQMFRQCCDFSIDARGNVISYEGKSEQCKTDCKCD